jgi:hypothetical protein
MTFNTRLNDHTVSELFTTSPILSELMKKVEQLTKLNRTVVAQLDPELAKHCRVTNCREGILTLTTSSPAWGHTLRFSEIELLSTLRSYPEWCGLKAVRTFVRPLEVSYSSETFVSPFPEPILKSVSAEFIKKAAESVESSLLRKALIKLANRAR